MLWSYLRNILRFNRSIFSSRSETLYIRIHFWKKGFLGNKKLHILREALTHPSYDEKTNYERLEFLGDSVWGLIVSSYLFEHYPKLDEGELTLLKAYFTNNNFISKLAKRIGLDDVLKVGKSYKFPISDSTLADIFESFVAYLYLAYGFNKTKKWGYKVMDHLFPSEKEIEEILFSFDPKGKLQSILGKDGKVPRYDVTKDGSLFKATVYIDGKPVAKGVGYSIREAEKNAAHKALMVLTNYGQEEE